MRSLLGILLALALTAPAAGAEKPWDFVVGEPTTAAPLPAGSTPRSLSFVRAFVDMPEGRQWASVLVCCSSLGRDIVAWQGNRSDVDTADLAHEFDETLAAAGFSEGPRTSLFNDGPATELQVGAVIGDLASRLCSGCGLMTPQDQFKGAASMSIEWQIYSPLDRKVVLTVKTSGAYEADRSQPGVGHILDGAFRENVRQLLNTAAFRDLVVGGSGHAASEAQSPRLALRPSAVSASRRSISDSVNAVAAVFANSGMGSGFLVSPDGYVLTNQHVVGDARYVKLKWSDGAETLGEVIRRDSRRDVALIKADAGGRSPLAVRATPAKLGETVYAIGTPLDVQFQNTVTKGIVSANRDREGQAFIQSDAAITHGNSGGPLLDDAGAVLAIAVAVIEPNGASANINFFIPINDAMRVLNVSLSADPAAAR